MSRNPEPPRRHGAVVLLLWLAALLAGGVVIARSTFNADLSAFLPANPDAQQRLLIEQLQSGVAARSLLIGIDGGNALQRADASRTLAGAMRASPLFEQVQNGGRESWQAAGEWLFQHRYLLSPAVNAERFSVAGLRDAIDETLSALGTPGGAAKALLESDPTGEVQRIAEALIPATAPRIENGVWVSREGPRALLLASTRADGGDLDAQAAALEFIGTAFAPSQAQGLSLQLSGPPVFAVQSRARIEHEARQLALVGSGVIGALLLLAFRSLRALGIALLPVASGVISGIVAVSGVFGSVHGLTLGFGSTLIGETVDYAIYYLIQARAAGAAPGTGWQRWRDQNWPTVRLGLMTSVCGFAALVFSGFPGLAQLGVFSLAGLTGAALATRYVLPVLAPDGTPGEGLRHRMARAAGAVIGLMPRLRWPVLLLGGLALAVLAHRGGAIWSDDLASLSPVSTAAQQLDAQLRAALGASDARTLVVAQGADPQAALRAAEAATPRLDTLVAQGKLLGYETPTRLLPSVQTQQARLAALPEAEPLRRRLAEATGGGPLPAARLAPFIEQVQAARQLQPLQRAALDGSPLAPVVDALMFQRPGGGWSVLLALQPPAQGLEAAAVRTALQGVADVQVIDIKDALDRLYHGYLQEAFGQVSLGAAAVVLLLALYLRSWRRLAAVCQPLALAVLLTAAALVALGVSLSILHLVGLLLVVAVGSNYALFFDQLRTQGRADDDTLASLLLANLTTVVSFGLIAMSQIPPLSAIGRTVAPGALLALLLAAAFARPTAAR